ncbi:MAG TPA: T9SS type A sorting domain-containing protein [Chryseosolibacter sp.]
MLRKCIVLTAIVTFGTLSGWSQEFDQDFGPILKSQAFITDIAETPEGDFIVVGNFDYVKGEPSGKVVKLMRNGEPDPSFQKVYTDFGVDKVEVMSDGRIVIQGLFTRINGVTANHLARLNSDGTLDETFTADPSIPIGVFALQSDGRIITGPGFVMGSGIYRLNLDGSLDNTFSYTFGALKIEVDTNDDIYLLAIYDIVRLTKDGVIDQTFDVPFLTNPEGQYQQIKLQHDGKVLVSGNFENIYSTKVDGFLRFNHDGTLDDTFTHSFPQGAVQAIAVTATGNIFASGMSDLYRIDPDGTSQFISSFYINWVTCLFLTDDNMLLAGGHFKVAQFTPVNAPLALFDQSHHIVTTFAPELSSAPQAGGKDLALTTENKILLGGTDDNLMAIGDVVKSFIRINGDGTYDDTFDPAISDQSGINALEVQHNKGILLSGYLRLEGGAMKTFVRLNRDGSYDEDFVSGAGPDNLVYRIRFNGADIFLGGGFTSYNNIPSQSFVILNHKGVVTQTFSGVPQYSIITDFDFQSDGKIVAIGSFNFPDGYRSMLRLNTDGTRDESFPMLPGTSVSTLKIDAQDRIYIGGYFHPGPLIKRLNPDGTPDETFTHGALLTGNSDFHYVSLIDILPTNQIVIGGNFNEYNGVEANGVIILEKDGASFRVPTPGLSPSSVITRLKYHGAHIYIGGKLSFEDGKKVIGLGKLKLAGSEIIDPSAPENVTSSTTNPSEMRLNWKDKTDAEDGYQVERQNPATGAFEQIGILAANSTAFIDSTSLAGARTKDSTSETVYRVRSFNSVSASEYVYLNVTTPMPAPVSVSSLTITQVESSLKVFWTDNSSVEDGFVIERSVNSENAFVRYREVAANTVEYLDTEIADGNTYYYRVYAYNSTGTSSKVSANFMTVPATPQNVSVAEISSALKLTWIDNSANESGFRIERSVNANEAFILYGQTQSGITEFIDQDIAEGNTYQYRIAAFNAKGVSSRSKVYHMMLPVTPSDVTIAASGLTLTMQWKDNSSNETAYRIDRSINDGQSYVQYQELSANATQFTDTDITSGNRYFYRVLSINERGVSPPAEVSFELLLTSLEQRAVNGLAIYPNPCSHWLTISSDRTVRRILMVNSLGQKVYDVELAPQPEKIRSINLSELPKGVYWILIDTGTAVQKRLVVKN